MRVGLTGGIGSGKSAALVCFAKMGYAVLSADEISRALYLKEEIQANIKAAFPALPLDDFGRVRRASLRAHIIRDDTARQSLESILHPLIYEAIEAQIPDLEAAQGTVVVEVPLLLEKRWVAFDRVLLLTAPLFLRESRLSVRGLSRRR